MAMVKLKKGDMVLIPLGDDRGGVAQASFVTPGDSVYLLVFDELVEDGVTGTDLDAVAAHSDIRLASWTSSVLVETGHWKVIGSFPVRENLPLPAYKVAIDRPGNFYVEDWRGERRRPATPEESALLPLRSHFSPAAVEGALKGQVGLGPWLEAFEAMIPGDISSQSIFGDG